MCGCMREALTAYSDVGAGRGVLNSSSLGYERLRYLAYMPNIRTSQIGSKFWKNFVNVMLKPIGPTRGVIPKYKDNYALVTYLRPFI